MTFHRARSEEQRELRRRVILDTAAAMLDEMPAGDPSRPHAERGDRLATVLSTSLSRHRTLCDLAGRYRRAGPRSRAHVLRLGPGP
jgi:hypothetical protein